MTSEKHQSPRSSLGYGSSYRRDGSLEGGTAREIEAVLGGQVWKVTPDKRAEAANPCLWMQAGIVKFKNCSNFYDCTTCRYDHAMGQKAERGEQRSWQNAMRLRPALERMCRHSLTHRIGTRVCALDYNCFKCDFDQFFEEVWSVKAANSPHNVEQIKGFDVPMDCYFHEGHGWARIESGGYIRVGLDDFALKLLGQADALDLPLMGKELEQGRQGWGLKRRDNLAGVLSPVSGVIMEVNGKVRENPGLANRQPYADGWLFLVRTPDIKATVKGLMAETQTLGWMNGEVDRLQEMVEQVAGPLAADGGYFSDDIYGNLPQLDWKALTGTFLKT